MSLKHQSNIPHSSHTSLLVKIALGVSPLPVIGEVALSMAFYQLGKNNDDAGGRMIRSVAIPAALLTRYALYTGFYLPLYEKAFS